MGDQNTIPLPPARRARAALHSRVRGQALILAVVTLLVLCLGVIVLFNTGQAVGKKVELVNAADAGAYSAAVEQARAYNLIAYMNRAEVANEVAVAQMVSWYSWMNYTLRGTDNFKDAVQAIAILFDISVVGAEIGAALQEVVSALNEVKSVVKEIRDGAQVGFSAGVTAIAALNEAYSAASFAIATVDPAERVKIAKDVAERNTAGKASIGSRGTALLLEDSIAAARDTQYYKIPARGTDSGAERFADVVMEARDGFSRQRNGGIGPLHKRGGTDLIGYRDWVGVDDLNVKFRCCLGFIKLDVPMAWGGAAAVESGHQGSFRATASPGYHNGHGWDSSYGIDAGHYSRYAGALDNGKSSSYALNSPAMDGSDKAWLKDYAPATAPGLSNYEDVVGGKATVPYLNGKSAAANGVSALDAGPVFTVLVEQPMRTVHTANNVPGMGGPPDLQAPDRTVANDMTALSSAQAYFSRPRALFPNVVDSRRELGNLFSPYWQARLVDTPCAKRQQVAASYGTLAPCVP